MEHAVAVQVVEGQEQLREPAAHPLRRTQEHVVSLLNPEQTLLLVPVGVKTLNLVVFAYLFGEEDASRLLDPLRPAKNFDVIEIEKTYW